MRADQRADELTSQLYFCVRRASLEMRSLKPATTHTNNCSSEQLQRQDTDWSN
ncbi:UNVERIFIED_CONTAM: hypothetical protein FKN15_022151 [Acipenser sinensis]